MSPSATESMVNVDSSYPKILRVGIIGLGEIAQVAHIPILQNLRHLYEITAICDVSKKALAYCSSRFHIKQTFTSATDLIACSDVDVVFVLNSDEFHATFAIEAINAGKHVLIEKPMALTLSECDAIIAASKAHAESIVFVAYMRRYASAFEQACEMVKSFETILHARVRSVIGPNSVFVDQGGMYPQRFADFPESATAERNAALGKVAVEVLGANAADQGLNIWWRILNGLSSHDLSAMREMLGVPKRVLAAHTARQGMFLNAIFDYGNFNCQLETGIDALARFDAFIEVTGPTRSVKIAFDTPYIKGLPVKIEVTEVVDGVLSTSTKIPTYLDPYTIEMETLHKTITNNLPVKTTPEDARNETVLFLDIMKLLEKESAERRL